MATGTEVSSVHRNWSYKTTYALNSAMTLPQRRNHRACRRRRRIAQDMPIPCRQDDPRIARLAFRSWSVIREPGESRRVSVCDAASCCHIACESDPSGLWLKMERRDIVRISWSHRFLTHVVFSQYLVMNECCSAGELTIWRLMTGILRVENDTANPGRLL